MHGETIGNFKIVSRLGRGGMGEVWLAEQQSIGTKVAIKLLHDEVSSDGEHVQRFFNEARAVGRIQHAGIAKIFDVGVHHGRAYLVMEYLEGETLARRIARAGRLPVVQLAEIGRQIASVLDATHGAGITHRDLKPDNVFLVPDRELARGERVKVLDFGIAKLTGTLAAASPRTIGTMGTPAYMAPEQWGDASKVDWRADLYSLGCVTFEMACGRPPFVVTTVAEACAMHLHDTPPVASSIAPASSPQLDRLIASLLAKRPEVRPASMLAVSRAFAAIGGSTEPDGFAATVSTADVTPFVPASSSTRRRTPPIVAVAFAVAATAGAGGYLLATRTRAAAPPPPVVQRADVAVAVAPPVDAPIAPDATTVEAAAAPDAGHVVAKHPQGSTDRYDVVRRIMSHFNELHRCYASSGKTVSVFTIGLDGRVTAIRTTGMADEVTTCVAAAIHGVEFARPVGGPVEISFPFTSGPELAFQIDAGVPADESQAHDGIVATFHQVEPKLDACAARGDIHGKIGLAITVSPAGRVISVSLDTFDGTPFASCIGSVLRAAAFPVTQNQMKITVPMVFQ